MSYFYVGNLFLILYILLIITCIKSSKLVTEPDLKLKLRVQLINQAGAEEAGVDGGGLFREFLSELLK